MALKLLCKAARQMTGLANLAPLETEVIDLFVHLARALGFPKSVAEIYGLLFISPRPLAMDEIIARLKLSKGSVSQGLKLLRGLSAVRTVYVGGKRNDHYEAELELRKLARGFLKDKLLPHVESGGDRLSRIESALSQLPAAEREWVLGRLDRLKSWQQTGEQFLPLVRQFWS